MTFRLDPLIFSIFMLIIAFQAHGQQLPTAPKEFIFDKAPFKSCHASTIAEATEGLVAAWFAGSYEGNPDVEIWFSRRIDGKWTTPVAIANGIQYKEKRYPCFNPVLFQAPDGGPLMLFYKVGADVDIWWGMLTKSFDGGKTWSFPQRLPEGILGPIKNKPVMIGESTLLCPSSTEDDGWRIHFEITGDWGQTWEKTQPSQLFNVIQPSVLKYGKDTLQALSRSKENRVASTWSFDNGQTWETTELSELPNPNSGTDAVSLRWGLQLIVYNHSIRDKGKWGGLRFPLNVAVSRDGKLWKALTVLESAPGEYSYPSVIEDRNGLVHITYSCKTGPKIPRGDGGSIFEKERIAHVTLDLAGIDFESLPEI